MIRSRFKSHIHKQLLADDLALSALSKALGKPLKVVIVGVEREYKYVFEPHSIKAIKLALNIPESEEITETYEKEPVLVQ